MFSYGGIHIGRQIWSTYRTFWERTLHISKQRTLVLATSSYLSARFIFYGAFILNFKLQNFLQATLYTRSSSYQSSVLYIIFSTLTSSLVLGDSFGAQQNLLFAKYSLETNNMLNSQCVWFTLNSIHWRVLSIPVLYLYKFPVS